MQSPHPHRTPRWTALAIAWLLLAAGAAGAATSVAVSSADTLDSLAPQITLVAPVGGETLTIAHAETLRWQIAEPSWPAAPPITVTIVDSAATLLTDQVAADPAGQYVYVWNVPEHQTASARLIVQATDRFGWAAADTGGTFTIQQDLTDVPSLLTDRIGPVYPNPFNPSTTIAFSLAAPADVRLGIYDLQGREIARLVDGRQQAGGHSVAWNGRATDGRRVASGTYLARLAIDGTDRHTVHITRLTLVK